MKYLTIQIQPERSPNIDKNIVILFLKDNGYMPEVDEGNDSGEYINISIKTNNIKTLWLEIMLLLKSNKQLSSSSIITCEGSQGWDNYFLLHHYDSNEELDTL